MRNLSKEELINVNGGEVGGPVPVVSSNGTVQGGYEVGYRIGRAIGDAAANVLNAIESVGDTVWGWFD